MGDLPFNNTGVDCFGPYYVKKSKMTRTTKGVKKCYGVLFTCLTTRAIHIELAGDLSTDGFLLGDLSAVVEPSKSFDLITEQTLLEPTTK